MAASERIFKLLDEPIPDSAAAGTRRLEKPLGEIEFRNVWFAYHGGENPKDEDWVLRDVSFRVLPGQTAAIVGHTGAGKTTVVQLLLRFYEIQRGEILLDGIDIREFNVQDLRRQFGIVLQDPFLFTGTMESNVNSARKESAARRWKARCSEVGLGPLLRSLPARSGNGNHRARRDTFRRPATARKLCASAGAQSALPDSRRSDLQRRYENRGNDSRSARSFAARTHRGRNRASPEHHSTRRFDSCIPQRQAARKRFASGIAGRARNLLPPLSASI